MELEIGKYKIKVVEKIGRGGFGDVFKAVDKSTGEFYALKQLEKLEEDLIEDVLNGESELQSQLDHPNIVKYVSLS